MASLYFLALLYTMVFTGLLPEKWHWFWNGLYTGWVLTFFVLIILDVIQTVKRIRGCPDD